MLTLRNACWLWLFFAFGCESPDLITNPMIDRWCGERPCGWEVAGKIERVGTWHTHPRGGTHSGTDRETLGWLAEEFGGLPAVSLIWTPGNLICAVDRR